MTDATPDKEKRPHGAAWTVVLTICLLAGYAAGYLIGQRDEHVVVLSGLGREFRHPVIARIFVPAAWIEAQIRRTSVTVHLSIDTFGPRIGEIIYKAMPLIDE